MSSLSDRINIARVNIEFFTGFKKIKQRRTSFVLGYSRMILSKMSTAISIKHRILANFNNKIDRFYTKTTQKWEFSKLCVKIKKKMLYRPIPFFNT
jgi:hypothetical protein